MIWYYNEIEGDSLSPEEIPIHPGKPILIISELGSIHCFISPIYKDDRHITSIKGMPTFKKSLSLAKLASLNQLRGVVELCHGALFLANPKQMFDSNLKYKSIECNLLYTGRGEQYKAVFASAYPPPQIAAALTRYLFGLTSPELNALLSCLQSTLYHGNNVFGQNTVPRLVYSSNTNICEISGMYIPATFPYIAFAPSGEAYSHISLHSFYQFAKFLPTTDFMKEAIAKDSNLEKILHQLSTTDYSGSDRILATASIFAL